MLTLWRISGNIWAKSRMSVQTVGRHSASLPIWRDIRESTQGKGPISVQTVGRVSAEAPTSIDTRESTQGRSLGSARIVGKTSTSVQPPYITSRLPQPGEGIPQSVQNVAGNSLPPSPLCLPRPQFVARSPINAPIVGKTLGRVRLWLNTRESTPEKDLISAPNVGKSSAGAQP